MFLMYQLIIGVLFVLKIQSMMFQHLLANRFARKINSLAMVNAIASKIIIVLNQASAQKHNVHKIAILALSKTNVSVKMDMYQIYLLLYAISKNHVLLKVIKSMDNVYAIKIIILQIKMNVSSVGKINTLMVMIVFVSQDQ